MSFRARIPEDHVRPSLACGESRTKQSMKDESNINLIMHKFRKTGVVTFVNNREAEYMDTENLDFHQAMNAVIQAKQMFSDMPAHMRKRFNNDPGEFLDFVHNPENAEEMADLGLVKRNPEQPSPATSEAKPETSPPGDSAEGASP